jgi:hypothetical protein
MATYTGIDEVFPKPGNYRAIEKLCSKYGMRISSF